MTATTRPVRTVQTTHPRATDASRPHSGRSGAAPSVSAGLRRVERPLTLLLLIVASVLALTSLQYDSITYDETSHLTAGFSYLKTGDFRLAADHPPLAKMWAAWPLLLTGTYWPGPETPGWEEADVWLVGRHWLYGRNDGERLVRIGRMMMLPFLLGSLLCIRALAKRLFGATAGLLAMAVAALSSTMLAHGRYVTTDMPVVCFFLLTLLAWNRCLEKFTLGRLLTVGLAMSGLALVKFSWPLILPALALMLVVAAVRREPIPFELPAWLVGRSYLYRTGLVESRFSRAALYVLTALFVGAFTWAAIWTCFGLRYNALPEAAQTAEAVLARIAAWDHMLADNDGRPLTGTFPTLLRTAQKKQILPDAYLFGLAYTYKSALERSAYLMGELSEEGWWYYFPVAFAIKTELAVLLLLVAGTMAVVRVHRCSAPLLMIGLLGFSLVYAWSAVGGNLNIGHRHILPLYPLVFVLAGAAAPWLRSRIGQGLVVIALGGLIFANARIYPQYLCYFNELVGGPASGWKYLADSNVDWGQDLLRLAAWAQRRERPQEPIKLAYFGTADPSRYGFPCEMLPSTYPFAEPAALTPGTYVVSVNQLLGVYEPTARASYWTPERLAGIDQAPTSVPAPPPPASDDERPEAPPPKVYTRLELEQGLLISRLRDRTPDARIGYSLFVYELDADELAELLRR